MQPFDVTVAHQDGIRVLIVSGEIDMATSERFRHALTGALAPGVTTILDMSAVSFMDSQGLNVLLSAEHEVEASGARLSIVPSPAVHRVLEVSGAALVLDVRPIRAEAA